MRSWQDPIVENAFMQMIIDTAALFKNEPGLQHMLEFTPGPTSPTHLESLTRNANNDPSNPIFNSFARCSDAVMTLKQVQKHVDITMTACDMFVEALNFNEGN